MLSKIATQENENQIIDTYLNNECGNIDVLISYGVNHDLVCIPTYYNQSVVDTYSSTEVRDNKSIICDEAIYIMYNSLVREERKVSNNKTLVVLYDGFDNSLANNNLIESVHENERCLKLLGYEHIFYLTNNICTQDKNKDLKTLLLK